VNQIETQLADIEERWQPWIDAQQGHTNINDIPKLIKALLRALRTLESARAELTLRDIAAILAGEEGT